MVVNEIRVYEFCPAAGTNDLLAFNNTYLTHSFGGQKHSGSHWVKSKLYTGLNPFDGLKENFFLEFFFF